MGLKFGVLVGLDQRKNFIVFDHCGLDTVWDMIQNRSKMRFPDDNLRMP